MTNYGLPLLYTLLLWWFTTGVLLYLHRLPANTYRWSMLAMTLVAGAAFYANRHLSQQLEPAGAYLAFSCGVLLWGWLELGYFTGLLVGPHREDCPAPCKGWRRFRLAVMTSLYHEIGIFATAGILALTTWGAPNQVGLWGFVVLWFMRWSAKLNLFLGVPNLNEHWLPEQMRFLSTYMLRRPMNPFFPVSITAATVILGILVQLASEQESLDFQRMGFMLVSSLLALGILEHWFLVMPFSEEVLWRWALRGGQNEAQEAEAPVILAEALGAAAAGTEGAQISRHDCDPCL